MGSTSSGVGDNQRVSLSGVDSIPKSWTVDGAVWRFGAKGSINWNSVPNTPGISGNLGKAAFSHWFAQLMRPVQCLVEHLATECSATTMIRTAQHIKEMAAWMLKQSPPLKTFRNLSEYDVKRFVSYLKERPPQNKEKARLSKGSLASRFEAIYKMYRWREVVGDGIQFPPFGDHSPERFAGRMKKERAGTRTKLIPDMDHHRLFLGALEFIRSHRAQVVAQLSELPWRTISTETEQKANIDPDNRKLSNYDRVRTALDRFEKGNCLHLPAGVRLTERTLTAEVGVNQRSVLAILDKHQDLMVRFEALRQPFPGGQLYWDRCQLAEDIRNLTAAAYVIIASSTGMRVSEILSLQPGCVHSRNDEETGQIHWVEAILDKTSIDHVTEWLVGGLGLEAIRALEQLHHVVPTSARATKRTKEALGESLFRIYEWDWDGLIVRPLFCSTIIKRYLNRFIDLHVPGIGYVGTHQFRRTFARNVVRYTDVDLLALRRHFKHWSVLMTEHYVGIDYELIQLWSEEHRILSEDRIYRILSSETAGPGGLIVDRDLQTRMDRGELPKNYLGEANEIDRRSLANTLGQQGFEITRCGEFTWCAASADGFADSAKCGGKLAPIPKNCYPTTCRHSHIPVEDVPFHFDALVSDWERFHEMESMERQGPGGIPLLRSMRDTYASIKKLVPKYAVIAKGLNERLQGMSEVERNSDLGMALIRRVNRDTLAFQIVGAIADKSFEIHDEEKAD